MAVEPGSAPASRTHSSDCAVTRAEKEKRLVQRGKAIWLYGLSGAGKSTLAVRLERHLHSAGFAVHFLDGDAIRAGLNRNLGFDDESRAENIRRVAEVAKLFIEAGLVVICAAITPRRAHRQLAAAMLGDDFIPVHVGASFEACARRDPKGLYRRALNGQIPSFTGLDSTFEPPVGTDESPTINTEGASIEASLAELLSIVTPRLGHR